MENQILLEKVGETKTQKLIDDCYKIYKEKFQKQFPDFLEKNHTKICSVVSVTEKDEVKGIGMSCLNDLLLDNWGIFFNAFMGGTGSDITLTRIGGATNQLRMWGAGGSWNTTNAGALGSEIKVGTGVTPATRQNFNIEAGSLGLNMGNGGFNSGLGKVDIPANLVSLSSFSLSETGLFGRWIFNPTAPLIDSFMLSRDNISPVVSVIIGQTINVDYQLLLS